MKSWQVWQPGTWRYWLPNALLMDHGEGSFFVVLTGIYFAGLSQTRLRGAAG